MSDSYFDHNGARIAYQYTGSGRPVCYAHGVPLSREAVRRTQLFEFDSLADGHHLLTYDARGHGHSTGRPIADDYSFENFTQDLLALMDAVGIDEPMDFVGSSLGADTALRAALAAPDRFRRLVLMIPPAAWTADAEQAKQWYGATADAIETRGLQGWLSEMASADPMPIFADHPEVVFAPDVPEKLLPSVLRGVGGSDLPARSAIATLNHPTLILTWDTDPLHPIVTAETLHELIPGSELHVAKSVAEIRAWTSRITDFLAH